MTTIHRFGPIEFDSVVGYFNKSDFICQVIGSIASLSTPPPIHSLSLSTSLSVLCVDDAAAHMVMLSDRYEQSPRPSINTFIHAGRSVISWRDVLNGLSQSPLVKWNCDEEEKIERGERDKKETRQWVEGMFQSCPLLRFHLEKFKMRCGDMTPLNLDRDLERILFGILPERNPMICQQTDDLLVECLIEREKRFEKGEGAKNGEEKKIEARKMLCYTITKETIMNILLPAMARAGFLSRE